MKTTADGETFGDCCHKQCYTEVLAKSQHSTMQVFIDAQAERLMAKILEHPL